MYSKMYSPREKHPFSVPNTGIPSFIVLLFIVHHRYYTFHKSKVYGNPAHNKFIGTILHLPTAFADSMCHILVILIMFQTFSFFFFFNIFILFFGLAVWHVGS